MVDGDDLVATARRAFEIGAALNWQTYDPYDLLLSPLAAPVSRHWPLGARALLQVGRHTGPRVRRAMHVPRHEEPKAIGDFLQAAAALTRSGIDWAPHYLTGLSTRLERAATTSRHGVGWGLSFPWISRFGTIAQGEPNIYTTTVACRALLDAHELGGNAAALSAAAAGGRFIVADLGSLEHRGLTWLRYTRTADSPIVNVQASSASLFARLSAATADRGLLDVAHRAAEAAVAAQRDDGSWPYSDDAVGRFVDGFHTGFTLQGLHEYALERPTDAVAGAIEAIERGFAYFKQHLLTPEGQPRRFANGRATRDGQTLAQAVQTLVVCGGDDDVATAARIWSVARSRIRLDAGSQPMLRWSLGPFVLATAFLVRSASPR
jgi:hypothetical protein